MKSFLRAIATATLVLIFGFGFMYGLQHNPHETAIVALGMFLAVVIAVWYGTDSGHIEWK